MSTLHEMNRLGYNEMNDLRYVFVAAPMSGPPNEYLANCSRMSQYSRSLIEQGVCPINPAADMLDGLVCTTPLTDEQYKARSMDLLRLLEGRDDAQVHVLAVRYRDGTLSDGVAAEIDEARQRAIPVVFVDDEPDRDNNAELEATIGKMADSSVWTFTSDLGRTYTLPQLNDILLTLEKSGVGDTVRTYMHRAEQTEAERDALREGCCATCLTCTPVGFCKHPEALASVKSRYPMQSDFRCRYWQPREGGEG